MQESAALAAPPEVGLPAPRRLELAGDALDLRVLMNVVESGVSYWQQQLASTDTVTREQAASALDELAKILQSLSRQLALGRTSVRITTRLPTLRAFDLGCAICGSGNRHGARFCQRCGAPLGGPPAKEAKLVDVPPLRFVIAARSDIGRVRKMNQDSLATSALTLADESVAHLCLVADGMGGAQAGERASSLTAQIVREQIAGGVTASTPHDDAAWQELLRTAVHAANHTVYSESRTSEARRGMGTTITVALFVGERVHLASVGDSRAYLTNSRGVTVDNLNVAQLTSDHSLVARLVDIGQITAEEARSHPQRNLLYRSIGTDPVVEIDTRSEQLEAGDTILLCSDGLFNFVRDAELARIALAEPDIERACTQLIALANERGGSDNITVIIVRVEPPAS